MFSGGRLSDLPPLDYDRTAKLPEETVPPMARYQPAIYCRLATVWDKKRHSHRSHEFPCSPHSGYLAEQDQNRVPGRVRVQTRHMVCQ